MPCPRRAKHLAASILVPLAPWIAAACSSDPQGPYGTGGSTSGTTTTNTTTTATTGTTTSTSTTSTSADGGPAELPFVFEVTGVVTDGTDPVEGAIVMQGGAGEPAMITGPDGAFAIELTKAVPGTPTVIAAKLGYRTQGEEFLFLPEGPVTLALRYVTPEDNESYEWGDPGQGNAQIDNSTKYCGHCHTTLVAEFRTSAHEKATRDPLVQDLYAGVSRAFDDEASCDEAGGEWRKGLEPGTESTALTKCYLGGGVLPDLNPGCGGPGEKACDDPALPKGEKPTQFGLCADCHAPGIDGKAGGRDLHDAVGVAYDAGNHCDVCHHVRDVDLGKPPGVGGALLLTRPFDKISEEPGAKILQVMFGPLPDVPNGFMGGSYQPIFRTSDLCGGCHEQKQPALLPGASLDPARWPDGLPTHSTYAEWQDSAFDAPGTPCQFCHMPPIEGLESTVDVTDETNASIAFGFVRPPEDIRSHTFRGPLAGMPRLIDDSIAVFLSLAQEGGGLTANVTLKNIQVGHAVPTGEPMRALVLVVRGEACGVPLQATSGMTLNDVAGALALGTAGDSVAVQGSTMTWPAGAAAAKKGAAVRVVRPTGTFDDYPGIGFFADPLLAPEDKGLEILAPAGEALVVAVAGGDLTLSAAIDVQPGDLVYLGDAAAPPKDGQASPALAGAAGYTFARVTVDPQGARAVPHYRAVDLASDNRIAPGAEAHTTHGFAVPPGCDQTVVTATLLYRPVPVHLARQRGWEAKDYIIAEAKETLPF